MKNTVKIRRTVKVGDAIADNKNNLYYAVDYRIIKYYDKQNPIEEYKNILMISERSFDARKRAYYYAFQLTENVVDGINLYNARTASIHIMCIDPKTGESIQVCEGKFNEPPDFYLDDCIMELEWYEKYGMETDGAIITVEDEDGNPHRILDYKMADEPDNPDVLYKISTEVALHIPTIVSSPEGDHYLIPEKLINDVKRGFVLQTELNLPSIH